SDSAPAAVYAVSLHDALPIFGDDGVVALRQAHDEAVGVGLPRRGLDLLLGGVGAAVGDVVPDGGGPEPGILKHHAVAGPQGLPGDRKSTRLNSSHISISYARF